MPYRESGLPDFEAEPRKEMIEIPERQSLSAVCGGKAAQ